MQPRAKVLRGNPTAEREARLGASARPGPELGARAATAPPAPEPSAPWIVSPGSHVQHRSVTLVERVRAAVATATDPRTGLAFVPTVVRSLSISMDTPTALTAMRAAARCGLIELRPESVIGRLTCNELALCPSGPDGGWLPWAKIPRSS